MNRSGLAMAAVWGRHKVPFGATANPAAAPLRALGKDDSVATTWDDVLVELNTALGDFVRGDATAYKNMWSTKAEISVMGAFGGVVVGQAQVRERLDQAAAMYSDGSYESFEVIAQGVGVEFGFIVWTERISSSDEVGSPITRARRATQVLRREGQAWLIVHQHSDPLVEVDLPT